MKRSRSRVAISLGAALALAASTLLATTPVYANEPDTPTPRLYVETSDGVIAPLGVSGCSTSTVSGGKKYTGCEVYTWVGWWSMSFEVDFTIFTNGKDRIDAIRSPQYSVDALYTATSTYNFSIGQKYETTSPAWARYTQQFKSNAGTYTKWVGVWVGGNGWGQNNSS